MGIGPLSTRLIKPNFHELPDRNIHLTKTFYSNFFLPCKSFGDRGMSSTDSTKCFFSEHGENFFHHGISFSSANSPNIAAPPYQGLQSCHVVFSCLTLAHPASYIWIWLAEVHCTLTQRVEISYWLCVHTVSGLESLLHRPKSFGTFRFSKVPNVFRVPEFQYLENEGFSRHITSPLLYFLFLLQHLKRPGFQNKQVEVAWMAFRGHTAFGTLEKRVPDDWTQANLICNSCIGNELLWGPVCKWVVPSPARPWGSGYHLVVPWIIDQFRYIIIQLKTINMTPRLQEIKKRVCMSFSLEPRGDVFRLRVNFNISKLVYWL